MKQNLLLLIDNTSTSGSDFQDVLCDNIVSKIHSQTTQLIFYCTNNQRFSTKISTENIHNCKKFIMQFGSIEQQKHLNESVNFINRFFIEINKSCLFTPREKQLPTRLSQHAINVSLMHTYKIIIKSLEQDNGKILLFDNLISFLLYKQYLNKHQLICLLSNLGCTNISDTLKNIELYILQTFKYNKPYLSYLTSFKQDIANIYSSYQREFLDILKNPSSLESYSIVRSMYLLLDNGTDPLHEYIENFKGDSVFIYKLLPLLDLDTKTKALELRIKFLLINKKSLEVEDMFTLDKEIADKTLSIASNVSQTDKNPAYTQLKQIGFNFESQRHRQSISA